MDYQEFDTKFFKLNQEGKEYILSISIYRDSVRLSCQENIGKEGNYFETDFTLNDLSEINRYFLIMSSIYEAQNELIKAIEKQKVGVENKKNLVNIVFYLIIGTDNISLKLPLAKRDKAYKRIKFPEEQEPFTGKIQLKNRGNYPQDEKRINNLEKYDQDLQQSQYSLINDMQNLIDVTENLIKETSYLYEENSKLNTRLKKIQKENYDRNLEVESLKEEEQILNDENIKLRNYNTDLEILLKQKKDSLQKNLIESKQNKLKSGEKDLGNGPKAISSRYETTQVKTFIPRITAKPKVEAYDEGIRKKSPFYFTDKRRTQFSHSNFPTDERLNKTDINIYKINPRKNSYKSNFNEFNATNNSYKINNFDKDPEDNNSRRNTKGIKKKIPAYERISEKTNDNEDEEKRIYIEKKNVFIKKNNNIKNQEDNVSYISQSQTEDYARDTDEKPYKYVKVEEEIETPTEQENEERESNSQSQYKYMNSDIIKSPMEESMLLNKLGKKGKNIKLTLLYKATLDTDRADIFHKKCNKAKKSLVIIETINGMRFGGYTTQSWEGNGVDKNDDKAFVFSLDKLQIYNIISGQPAIGCYPKYGPVFLGCQIKVNDNFFVKGGTTYRKNVNYAINSDFELNDGIKFFGIKEMEVFEVNLI